MNILRTRLLKDVMYVVLFVHLGTTTKIKSSCMIQHPMFSMFTIYYVVPHINRCTTTLCKHRPKPMRKDPWSLSFFSRCRTIKYWSKLTSVQLRFANTVLNRYSAGICYVELYSSLCRTTCIKMQQQTARTHVLQLCLAGTWYIVTLYLVFLFCFHLVYSQ